jgi:O-antigen/teichoic acid export membrane protein
MIQYVVRFFTLGNERSTRAKKNIAVSFVVRGLSIGISLLLVPLVLHATSPSEYGVWLTINSFIGWFSFFDIGLGNGLRNKFAEAMARNDIERARQYVSTTYAMMSLIIGVIALVFFSVNPFINWTSVFNASLDSAEELRYLVPVVFGLFSIQFIVQLLSTVLLADQRPAVNNVLGFLGSVLTLTGIYILDTYWTASLFTIGIVFTASPLIVLIAAHIVLYSTRYKHLSPTWRSVNFHYARELTSLGIQFFVIQIAVLILFTTSNMIIAQYLGPQEVTSYNIALKYFGIINSVFILIATPFWSAITDAYHRNDMAWIRNSVKKLVIVWGVFVIASVLMLSVSQLAYRFWVGETIQIPFGVSLALCIFVTLTNWSSIFATFLNGTGKIRLQLYSAVTVSLINIPLSIYLTGIYGLPGVILASICCVSIGSIWAPIQYYKLINNTATGIWAK